MFQSVRFPTGVLLNMEICILAGLVEERLAHRGLATGV